SCRCSVHVFACQTPCKATLHHMFAAPAPIENPTLTVVPVLCFSQKFAMLTALLAVKLFRPAHKLSDDVRLSDVLLAWVGEVLSEYGIGESDLFSSGTDGGGSDVRRLCVKVMTVSWEWCLPHVLDCA
ncbi:unnamed protein product, partial [Sphacelaria rigidula]